MLLHFNIGIDFIIEAALELCTLSGQLLRVHGEILETCGAC